MTIQFFDSPFHVTHDEEIASKMVWKWSCPYITDCIKKPGLKENEAELRLNVRHSRVPKPQDQLKITEALTPRHHLATIAHPSLSSYLQVVAANSATGPENPSKIQAHKRP